MFDQRSGFDGKAVAIFQRDGKDIGQVTTVQRMQASHTLAHQGGDMTFEIRQIGEILASPACMPSRIRSNRKYAIARPPDWV